ncbi:uncharacterized protein LOC106144203 [Microtus ochrogaster]|uniref:Uncharacterized protein LOC106144203 n=1 Tax=Microtus ochrogaster TaxID=79684 RepID=A0ABM1AS33_MICOH|nr:uncharacterized protein LOC106144203 [Microtus ochrogaster]
MAAEKLSAPTSKTTSPWMLVSSPALTVDRNGYESARRPRPPLHLWLHRGLHGGRPAHVPGRHARHSGTPPRRGPGPGLRRRAQPLSRPSQAAPQPAPRRPHLSRPDLSSPRPGGPRPTPEPLGPAPFTASARGPVAAAAHFRFPQHRQSPGLGNHLKPRPLGHAPQHQAPPPRPRGSAGCAQAQALRPRPPAPGFADERGNRRRLAVSARAHAGLALGL